MSENYKRNPKEPGGSKWISAQDEEDCTQEKLIQEWLKQQGNVGAIEFKHINRKGTARNTLVKAAFSLDQAVDGDDRSGTGTRYDAFIAGCDGRDLLERGDDSESSPEPTDKIYGYLFALGFNQEESQWLIKIFKLSITEKQSRLEKFLIDSE